MKIKLSAPNPEVLARMNAFMAEYERLTAVAPFGDHARVWNGCVVFEVKIFGKFIALSLIRTVYKQQGDGSRALDWLVALAKKHQVRMQGFVRPVGHGGLPRKELESWYARHGFVVAQDGVIELGD